ncbi:MAG: AGE family epimerase/isomerase [Caulobacter sp.]|nr:AGE family epimerase/isomerase [Caulobacter sp.]
MSTPAEVHALNTRLKAWLFDHALPLWWEVGFDRDKGGCFEKIDQDGKAVEGPRRARVAARQAWVYACAGRLGWTGPWREARDHALAALTGPFARGDGLYRILVAADGAPLDETANPYEQAFALLALSGAGREAEAVCTREALLAAIVRPDGGVHDDATQGPPLRANPMMHLFEAVQAWAAIGVDPGWRALADTIAGTARQRMIDPRTGALAELYGTDWSLLPEADIEPGHQFEWGWLLMAHDRHNADVARRLIEIGETRGIENGVAIFSLDQALEPRDRSARLWSQTERLHAHLAVGDWKAALRGAAGLQRYLDVPVTGLWRDRLRPDGVFVDEPAPASSLYHIVSAVMALDEACRV